MAADGSIPIFTIYINDISKLVSKCNFHFCADDTVLFTAAHSLAQAFLNMQSDFHVLQNCLLDLCLVFFFLNKTEYLVFSRSGNISVDSLNLPLWKIWF